MFPHEAYMCYKKYLFITLISQYLLLGKKVQLPHDLEKLLRLCYALYLYSEVLLKFGLTVVSVH